jgi:hypothetical protein
MRTRRQHTIDRALARILDDASPYLMPEQPLREELASRVTPRPSTTEVDDALRHADTELRLSTVQVDTGPKYKLSDIGQAWLSENP